MKIFLCSIFGHKYYVIAEFNTYSRKVGCRRCKKAWAMNDDVKAFLEWDGDFDRLYAEILTDSEMKKFKALENYSEKRICAVCHKPCPDPVHPFNYF